MSYENERKFLPKNDTWQKEVVNTNNITQSYLDLNKVIISLGSNKLILTINKVIIEKGITQKQHFLLTKYLSNPNKVLRIRNENDQLTLTLKIDIGIVGSQVEVESGLSILEYDILLKHCISKISKTRNIVMFDKQKFEIDVFKDNNEGLVLIEVELDDINQEINLPLWIGEEVTGNINYYNSVLAEKNL